MTTVCRSLASRGRASVAAWTALGALAAFACCAAPTSARAQDATAPTYFGRPLLAEPDRVAVAGDGTIYLAGWTGTPDLPASTSSPGVYVTPRGDKTGFYYVSAITRDGRYLWTSYARGGFESWDVSDVTALATGPDGSIWIAGKREIEPVRAFRNETTGSPTAFVARFLSDGTLSFATPLEGAGRNWIMGLAVLPDGDAIAVGSTSADDFPGSSPEDAAPSYFVTDAFVTRVRSDGAGVRWTRRYGGATVWNREHYGSGVAVDPSDGTILAAVSGPVEADRPPPAALIPTPRRLDEPKYTAWGRDVATFVLRFDNDGQVLHGGRITFLGTTTLDASSSVRPRTPLAVDSDGSVLVGGLLGIARLSPTLSRVESAWIHPMRGSRSGRIAVEPSGRVLVMEEDWLDDHLHDDPVAVLDRDLRHVEDLRGVVPFVCDIAVDGSGALLAAGRAAGLAYNLPPEPPGEVRGALARLPIDGVRPLSRIVARSVGSDSAELSWPADGDPAERFEFEAEPYYDETGTRLALGAVPGTATGHRVTGLAPATLYRFHVVSVFANGVRTFVSHGWYLTDPERPSEVTVERAGGNALRIDWQSRNGASARYDVEKRIGNGPWLPAATHFRYGRLRESAVRGPVTDIVPRVADVVRYRVRIRVRVTRGRFETPWTESAPLDLQPSLLLSPLSGRIGPADGGFEWRVAGSLAATDGSPLPAFDPAAQDFRLVLGDATAPYELSLPRGYPGWSAEDGALVWRARDAISGWGDGTEIAIDTARGTFRVRLAHPYAVLRHRTNVVALGLSVGDLAGGDVRAWRGSYRSTARLTFPGSGKPPRARVPRR